MSPDAPPPLTPALRVRRARTAYVTALQLTPEELAQYLDLGPYLNPSYYVVQVRRRLAAASGLAPDLRVCCPLWSLACRVDLAEASLGGPDSLLLYCCCCSGWLPQEDASLSKVYTLFRTLGLRHLCVIPKSVVPA